MGSEPDYYEMLGVTRSATIDEIKHAYRALARRYHPDSRTADVATTRFHEVQLAYSILGDEVQRRAYDRRLDAASPAKHALLSWDILISQPELYTGYEQQVFYVLLEVRQTSAEPGGRLPLNLCLVVDQSTSMQGSRLGCVKAAASKIIDNLSDQDVISIVGFSDRAEVFLASQLVSNRTRAKAKVSTIRAGGGTEILQGLSRGIAELKKHHSERVTSHLILLTDGRTYGDDDACIALAEQAGEQHIGITTMGIGEDWNDVLLDEVAKRSGGTSVYISAAEQVQKVLQHHLDGLGMIFAQNVKLSLNLAENVSLENTFKISPFLERVRVNAGVLSLGSLQSDVPLVVILALATGPRAVGRHRLARLELSADVPSVNITGTKQSHDLVISFSDDVVEYPVIPPPIISALRKVTLYEMQKKAWVALEEGNVEGATRQLEMVATRLFDLGESDLAQAAMLEAGRIASGALASARGHKQLKYGTRSLNMTSGRRSDD